MKPKPIMQDTLVSKKVRIETPIGNIESDSGNHLVDMSSVIIILLIFLLMRKFFKLT